VRDTISHSENFVKFGQWLLKCFEAGRVAGVRLQGLVSTRSAHKGHFKVKDKRKQVNDYIQLIQ
jgi:hypothetical protein